MAAVTHANRARMTTATSGTGTITLGSAANGFETFAAAGIGDGDLVAYLIVDGANWEIGTGTYTASGTTLSRSVSDSTNGDAAINLSGNAIVSIVLRAEELAEFSRKTGTETLENKTIANIILDGSVTEEVFAWSTTTGSNTTEFDPANGTVHTLTLTGNMTSVTDNVAAGESFIIGINDGTAYTFAWPTITWVNNAGIAPTLATSGYTWVTVWKVSTTLYGALIGDGT